MSVVPGPSSNPFDILGLDRTASFDDVKGAYRRLARQYHPDANPGDPTAVERFTTLRRAYDRLKIFYQTLDQAQPVVAANVPVTPKDTLPETPVPNTPPATSADVVDAAAPAASSTAAPGSDLQRTDVAAPSAPPADPSPSHRPAFHRAGAVRTSGNFAPRPGEPSIVGGSGPATPGSPPVPQLFGSGHSAARAEVLRPYNTVPVGSGPWMFYALIGLRASETIVFPRIPLNLALVLDHSSSMLRGGKVDGLKRTVHLIIDQLAEDDYLSIITFGDRAEVLLPAQPVRNKQTAHEAMDAMRCRGGTEISRGLAAGLSELSRNASRGLSHLILLTDGQTYGDELACLEHAEEAAAMDVGVTAYGLGNDWNTMLLDGIAIPTGGHSDYIESPDAIGSAFSARVTTLQSTTLHHATVSLRTMGNSELRRATVVAPLLRPLERGDRPDVQTWMLGDVSGNQDYRLLLEFVLPPRSVGPVDVASLAFCYDVPGLQRKDEVLVVPISTVAAPAVDPQAADLRIAAALRGIVAHNMQQQAWTALQGGSASAGARLLRGLAGQLEETGRGSLAAVVLDEAERIEQGDEASDEAVKRIIYGTRRLG